MREIRFRVSAQNRPEALYANEQTMSAAKRILHPLTPSAVYERVEPDGSHPAMRRHDFCAAGIFPQ